MLRKNSNTREIVIYNFDIKQQKLYLIFRGDKVPTHLKEYQRLWRVRDRERQVETVIISV